MDPKIPTLESYESGDFFWENNSFLEPFVAVFSFRLTTSHGIPL